MKLAFVCSAVAFSLSAVYSDSYPSQYPFENEATPPPAPRASTPDYTYTEDDPGGYLYTYAYGRTEMPPLPTSFMYNTQFNAFVNVNLNDIAVNPKSGYPERDLSTYNCTSKGESFIMSEESFPGAFKGQKVCETGACCESWFGYYGFWGGDGVDDYMLDKTEGEYDAGTCSEDISEGMYCLVMEWWSHTACVETYLSTGRINNRIIPCYDTPVYFYLSCPVYKAAGIIFEGRDPVGYNDLSSPDENTAHTAFWHSQDKICHPYSYYFQEYAKGSGSADSVSSMTSPASESSDSTRLLLANAMLAVVFVL